jgi:hypothetical protein
MEGTPAEFPFLHRSALFHFNERKSHMSDEKLKTDLFRQAEGRFMLSLDRVAHILDMPIKTLREMIRLNPPFPVRRVGRRIYVKRSDLERWVDSLP